MCRTDRNNMEEATCLEQADTSTTNHNHGDGSHKSIKRNTAPSPLVFDPNARGGQQ